MLEELTEEKIEELVLAAKRVRENAYAPYSGFKVGAALLTKTGKVFRGCNVENASFGLTVCAERHAIANAIAHGEQDFLAIAIVTQGERPASPCGACRQVIAEFSTDLTVIVENLSGERRVFSIGDLIPHLFKFKNE